MKKVILSIITVFVLSYCSNKVMAEYYWTQFRNSGDIVNLQKVLEFEEDNSMANMYMAIATSKDPIISEKYIDGVLYKFNGDIVLWSVWMQKGQNQVAVGNIRGAKHSFEKSLYYWPQLEDAKKAIASMDDIINSGKPIMIQFGAAK